jgi:uncharacterized protein YecE (DUF72 family)
MVLVATVDAITSRRLAYLRCHGRKLAQGRSVAERFDYDCPAHEVEEISERARVLADQAEEVHVMFNNNARDYAPNTARRCCRRLDSPQVEPWLLPLAAGAAKPRCPLQ